MSDWKSRRFWDEASVEAQERGYGILLDGRPLKTPSKLSLQVPTASMAEEIAAEWNAQDGVIDPTSMPWTRSANSAIEKVKPARSDVVAHLAGYAGSDLLCYRADSPIELTLRQKASWDPVISWVAEEFGAQFAVTAGIMPIQQADSTLNKVTCVMAQMSEFQLTGFHDLVTMSGSFLLAVKVIKNNDLPDVSWSLSRVDEDWQVEQWGVDDEAQAEAKNKKDAFLHAADFYFAS